MASRRVENDRGMVRVYDKPVWRVNQAKIFEIIIGGNTLHHENWVAPPVPQLEAS